MQAQPSHKPERMVATTTPRALLGSMLGVGLMSGVVNILYLTGSFFMLEVYDRVIPSHSIPTLIGLASLALGLYVFQGGLDLLRSRVLVRLGAAIDTALSASAFRTVIQRHLKLRAPEGLQPLRDLEQVRAFLSGAGPIAFLDLPWIPIYLALCFVFHPLIGLTAFAGSIILVALALLADGLTRRPMRDVVDHATTCHALAEAGRRNGEALSAMGMTGRLTGIWSEANARCLRSQRRASDVAGGLGAISKAVRAILQSAVLGVGGYLVIRQQATAGIIIAGSILTARALAPIEMAIAHWRGFVAARQSWRRLKRTLRRHAPPEIGLALPAPAASLSVEGISVTSPGGAKPILKDVSFFLEAGSGLGIIGPSASGKSTLARALVGVWAPAEGKVRLDGAALEQWSGEALGRHVGYLPQDVELFAGTVAQNISRFDPDPNPEDVIAAARAAGVHELILRLADGYETQIGEGGMVLSAGQRQRIALARALYGDPFLVVLDEPNANLDVAGDQALTRAILGIRARGGIVIIVAHRPLALQGVNHVLVMIDGKAERFGEKDKILAAAGLPERPAEPSLPPASPLRLGAGLRVVQDSQGATP
jgi:PrtD family type I secretion system ABC transporter